MHTFRPREGDRSGFIGLVIITARPEMIDAGGNAFDVQFLNGRHGPELAFRTDAARLTHSGLQLLQDISLANFFNYLFIYALLQTSKKDYKGRASCLN